MTLLIIACKTWRYHDCFACTPVRWPMSTVLPTASQPVPRSFLPCSLVVGVPSYRRQVYVLVFISCFINKCHLFFLLPYGPFIATISFVRGRVRQGDSPNDGYSSTRGYFPVKTLPDALYNANSGRLVEPPSLGRAYVSSEPSWDFFVLGPG